MSERPIKLTDEVLGGIRDILHRSPLTTKNAELYFAAIRALRDRAKAVVEDASSAESPGEDLVRSSLVRSLREVLP